MDDEYILFVIATSYETNPLAQHHYSTKLRRAILRRPAVKAFFRRIQPIVVNGQVTGAYEVDQQRAERFFSLMARGVFFSQFNRKWRGKLELIAPSFLRMRAAASPEYAERLRVFEAGQSQFFEQQPCYGENPDVFYYQVYRDETSQELLLRMVFYGQFSCVALRRRAMKPRRSTSGDA